MADQPTPPPPTGDDSGDLKEIKKKIEEAKQKEQESLRQAEDDEIEKLKTALVDAEAKALRSLADLQNARKRMEEEKALFSAYATQELVLQLLDIYDTYHRLMTHKPADLKMDEWHKGLELLDQQFKTFLGRQGVKILDTKEGEHIDPLKHEAVMTGEGEEGMILEVFSEGYEMRGRVIRTAKVKVGKGTGD